MYRKKNKYWHSFTNIVCNKHATLFCESFADGRMEVSTLTEQGLDPNNLLNALIKNM